MKRTRILPAERTARLLVTVVSCILTSTYSSTGSDQIPAKPQDHTIALTGATIHPVTGPAVEKGTIVFDEGKITALGANATIPEAAEIIDVSGKHVYPGLISADTYIGLIEIGAVRATRDRNETGDINPNVRAEVAVNPESELIPVARANGITMMVTSPSGGLISGTSAMMMMDGWTWEEMTFKAPAAMYVDWPRMTIITAPWFTRSAEDQKKERDKLLARVHDRKESGSSRRCTVP
jgi:imidazolonepropionase-like amidohydrolase